MASNSATTALAAKAAASRMVLTGVVLMMRRTARLEGAEAIGN
jgi:hypothetical protein